MRLKSFRIVLICLLTLISINIIADTGIRGLEVINGKMYASSEYRLYVVANQTELPIRSIEVKIDDGAWTTYAGNQLMEWCEGPECPDATGEFERNAVTRQGMKTRGTFSIAAEGMHTITTRASDILGNRSREHREVVFIDNTSPDSMLNAYYFEDPEYDTDSLEADVIDEQLVEDAESSFQRNGSEYVGPRYALHLEAFDLRSGVRSIQYRFGTGDTPWITVKREVQSATAEREPCEENVSEVQDVDYAEDVLTMFYALITDSTPPVMEDGWNILEVRLQDMVYNCSDIIAYPLYYDVFKPEPQVTPEVAFPILNDEIHNIATVNNQFLVSATDAGSGVHKIQIQLEYAVEQEDLSDPESDAPEYPADPDGLDPEGWHDYVRPINFVMSGFHRIWVRVVDNVGNVCEPYNFDVQIVINPPDTELRGADPTN